GFVLLVATVTGEREGLLVVVDSVGVAAASLQYATDEVQRCGFGEAEPCLAGEPEGLPHAVQRLLVVAQPNVVISEAQEAQADPGAVAGQLMGGQRLLQVRQLIPVPAPSGRDRGEVLQGPALSLVVSDGACRGKRLLEVDRGRVRILVPHAVAEAVEGRTLADAVADLPVERKGALSVLQRRAVVVQDVEPPREAVP